MGAVQLPIELIALQKKFEASIGKSTAAVKKLDASIEKTNANIQMIGKNANFQKTEKQFAKLEEQNKSLGKQLLKGSALIAAITIGVQRFGPVLLGTANITKAFARSLELVATFTTLATLRFNIFAQNMARGTGIIKVFGNGLTGVSNLFVRASTSVLRFSKTLDQSLSITRALASAGLEKLSLLLGKVGNGFSQLFGDIGKTAKQTEIFQKGIIGSVTRVAALGAGLSLLGNILQQSDNAFISFIGTVTEFAGLVLGPTALAFAKLLSVVGGVVQQIGDKLVTANLRAAQSFADAQLRAFTFERTIENFREAFPAVIAGTDEWRREIDKLNQSTGETRANLQASTAEIVSATAASGLNTKQMKLLLRASVDYAAQITNLTN